MVCLLTRYPVNQMTKQTNNHTTGQQANQPTGIPANRPTNKMAKADYLSALEVKIENKKWKSHKQLKKELGL